MQSKSNYTSNLGKVVSCGVYMPINSNCLKEKLRKDGDIENETDLKQLKKTNIYLKKEVIYKIIHKFLIEKKMPKESLAKNLEIKVRDLIELISCEEISPSLIRKVNLPLIKLYCGTKF